MQRSEPRVESAASTARPQAKQRLTVEALVLWWPIGSDSDAIAMT